MKKIIIPLLAVMTVSCLTACNTRATPNDNKINTISVTEVNEVSDKPMYFPISVSTMEEDGEMLLIKNFEVPSSVNPYDLVEQSFERGKYQYEVRDILKKNTEPKTDTKLASTQVVVNSNSNDMNKILKQAPVIIDYDKDGYRGQLVMNTTNLFTESLGTKSYSYTVTDTKTYTDLARNDTSYIAKSITKNGRELELIDIEWQTTGTNLVGSTLVPSSYNAVAYYSGTAYGSKSTGYATTITYIGEVTKELESNSVISIVYAGERIYKLTWLWFVLGGIVIAGAVFFIVRIIKKKETEEPEKNEKPEKENSDIAKERVQEAITKDKISESEENAKVHTKPKKDKVQVYVPKGESGDNIDEQT